MEFHEDFQTSSTKIFHILQSLQPNFSYEVSVHGSGLLLPTQFSHFTKPIPLEVQEGTCVFRKH